MGELARFEDIRIKMYPMDTQKHKEPHFHVILTDGNKVSVAIANSKASLWSAKHLRGPANFQVQAFH